MKKPPHRHPGACKMNPGNEAMLLAMEQIRFAPYEARKGCRYGVQSLKWARQHLQDARRFGIPSGRVGDAAAQLREAAKAVRRECPRK